MTLRFGKNNIFRQIVDFLVDADTGKAFLLQLLQFFYKFAFFPPHQRRQNAESCVFRQRQDILYNAVDRL